MFFTSLDKAVRETCGSSRKIKEKRPVFGGDINEAYSVTLDDGTVLFLKTNEPGSASFFEAEAEGLEAIRRTGAVSVPEILALGTDKDVSFLLMEFISGGQKIKDYWEVFAAELAAMHSAETPGYYGFREDNWIGARKQVNTPHDSWIPFFRDCRLQPQLEAAQKYFSPEDRKKAGNLLSRLDRFLTEPDRPALLHGDLWSGNMITGNDGKGWLIDPAVYYGHPEADLAMTELFGGFPARFYEAYREAGKQEPGYKDRRDLYNLYHLLNHLNLFGSGYLGAVLRILNRYAG